MNNDIVKIGQFDFKLLYTRQHIGKQLDKMAAKMDEDFKKILSEDPHAKFLLLGVLNGAYMFTSEISLRLKTPVMVQFVKISSYKGMESGQLTIDSRITLDIFKDAHVVILDDICDTGKTLAQLAKVVNGFSPKSIKIGVLVTRPDKEHEIEPDYSGLTCSQFIIGYGLDYNFYGRQYPAIYQKV